MPKKPKIYTLTNYRGDRLRIPGHATLGDLLKCGITFHSLMPIGNPKPKNRKIFTT